MLDPIASLRRSLLQVLLVLPFASLSGCVGEVDKSSPADETGGPGGGAEGGDEGGGDEGGGDEGGGDDTDSGVDTNAETGDTGLSPCVDGLDNDSDGWADAADPDCASGDAELGYGSTACNDGLDNDEDGAVDASDLDCADASGEAEGVGLSSCADGLDDDGDGWIDDEDPDCATGASELGVGDDACNDGEDNDGDGDVDGADPGCESATDSAEGRVISCEDGTDDDGDGWIDDEDPDCATGSEERGYGGTECNDGLDNEGDGDIDGDDPGCTGATDDAEGYARTGCEDGTDDDGDGWVDAADPDCDGGTSEAGYGTTACNDGTDNEGDGDIDIEDPGCSSALDDSEGAVTSGGSTTSDCATDCSYDEVVGGDRDVCYGMYSTRTYLMCMDMPADGCPDADTVDIEDLIDAECPTEPIVTWSLSDICGPVDPCDTECCYAVLGVERYWGGRPLSTLDGAVTAPALAREDWDADLTLEQEELSERARARLVGLWREMALAEHASVGSFARFSMQLLALGAPPELLLAAHRAAMDEVAHARLCFGVATALSGEAVGPGPLAMDGVLEGAMDAEHILRSAILEGCIGETLSAADAAAARDAAQEPAIRKALTVIAEDESRHAALAWRFVRWLLDSQPALRGLAARVFAEALAAESPALPPDPEAATLRRYGMLDAPTRARLGRRTLAEVVAPCAEALLAVG